MKTFVTISRGKSALLAKPVLSLCDEHITRAVGAAIADFLGAPIEETPAQQSEISEAHPDSPQASEPKSARSRRETKHES